MRQVTDMTREEISTFLTRWEPNAEDMEIRRRGNAVECFIPYANDDSAILLRNGGSICRQCVQEDGKIVFQPLPRDEVKAWRMYLVKHDVEVRAA